MGISTISTETEKCQDGKIYVNFADQSLGHDCSVVKTVFANNHSVVSIHQAAQCSIRTSFKNCTSVPVTVCDQTNIPITVEPNSMHLRQEDSVGFYIVRTYVVEGRNIRQIINRAAVILAQFQNKFGSFEILKAHERLKQLEKAKISPMGRVTIDCEYLITVPQLNSVFYDHRSNLVISSGGIATLPLHPHSPEARCVNENTEPKKCLTNACEIAYICKDKSTTPKFVNILGTVHKLIPQFDYNRLGSLNSKTKDIEDLSEYLIVFEDTHLPNSEGDVSPECRVYSMEHARECFGIYDCASDALSLGSPEKQLDVNLREAKERILKLQQEVDEIKLKREIEESNRKAEHSEALRRSEIDHQYRMNEMRSEYERRSSARKDITDFLKFITGMLLTIGSIALAMLKIMPIPNNNPIISRRI